MGILVDKFNKFIDRYKIKHKGQPHTHISIGNPKISYNIPDDKYKKFLSLYSQVIAKEITLHFVEKPLNPSLLRVDLDFKFTPIFDTNGNVSLDRNKYFTKTHIENIVFSYFQVIYDLLNLDDGIQCVVMLKEQPIHIKDETRDIIKDGIHLIFTDLILDHKIQHYIRTKMLEKANLVFSGIFASNDYSDIIDKAIIDSNCWQMFKSSKLNQKAYEIHYTYSYENNDLMEVEQIVSDNEEDDDNESATTDDLDEIKANVKKFSMRQVEYIERPINKKYEKELNEYITQLFPNKEKIQKYVDNMFLTDIRNTINNRVDDEKIELVKNIVNNCLNTSRADDYTLWVQLGMVLRNIDMRLLELWDDFSKNSEKYKPKECMKKWNSMKDDNLSLGTLIYWAKQDNPEKYIEIINTSLFKYTEQSIESQTHYDVAYLIYKKFNDEFKFIARDVWYMYSKEEHRYVTMMEGIDLSTKISTDIVECIKSRANGWTVQAMNPELDHDIRQNFLKKAEKAEKLINCCRLSPFKKNVINECKTFFQARTFEYDLNEKGNLIGFKNGVFDITKGIEFKNDITDIGFREGSPADCIRFTTNCNYKPYNKDDINVKELNDFLEKVLPDKEVRDYLMIQFALALDGNFRQERFFILAGKAGSGSNGKSTLINLVEKAFGDYFCTMNVSYITQCRSGSSNATPDVYRTKGVRMVVMAEPNENDKLNVGKLKEMTGNDTMTCRGLYKDQMEFKPQFSVFLTCNYVPEVNSNDEGTWRRIRLIEFTSRFSENPDINKPNEFLIDRDIPNKINRWKETFISMLLHIRIHLDVTKIPEPKVILDATKRFYAEQDLIAQFIADKIEESDDNEDKLLIEHLYPHYKNWFKSNTTATKQPLTRSQLQIQLGRNEPFISNKIAEGKWINIRIKEV
jgi:P4 family phage/plasmid primase-like protien